MSTEQTPAEKASEALYEYLQAWRDERRVTQQLFEARREMKERAKALLQVVPEGRYHNRVFLGDRHADVLITVPLWEDDDPPEIKIEEIDDLEEKAERHAKHEAAMLGSKCATTGGDQ